MWFANLKRKREQKRFEASLDAAAMSARSSAELSPDEVTAIVASREEFKSNSYEKIRSSVIAQWLSTIWELQQPSVKEHRVKALPSVGLPTVRYSTEPLAAGASLGWLLGMSREFRKSIQSIDRKLQGRILEALGEIVRDPMTPKGDTVKPLSHDMTGLWRYRLGDFRLIYQPIPERNQVLIMSFAPRGSAYS